MLVQYKNLIKMNTLEENLMTHQQIIEAIFKVLSEKMSLPNMDKFHSDARLLEDLGIDSSLVLQMLMFLELDHDLVIPEEALMDEDFETIRSIVKLMYQSQDIPKVEKGLEVYDDLKVHCVVSCLSEIVKRFPKLDHRILYFGVWDAEVCVDDQYILTYHNEEINHNFFFEWYEKLYGMAVQPWYDKTASKKDNIEKLASLVENRKPDQHIMVMLDMFHLPERKNEFSKDPFPHYVMLAPTKDPEQWFMFDPDYRWEGVIAKDRILNAVNQNTVSGGYTFSESKARPTTNKQIKEYFEASVILDHNPVTSTIRSVLTAHIEGVDKKGKPLPLENLMKALEEVPVLSPRKYAYEHGFAFFWREMLLPEDEFEKWCDVIGELTKTYKLIQFQTMKLSVSKKLEMADKIFDLLDQQDKRETRLKKRLQEVKEMWCQKVLSQSETNKESKHEAISM